MKLPAAGRIDLHQTPFFCRWALMLLAVASLLMARTLAPAVKGAAFTWQGGANNNWGTPANWVGNVPPTSDLANTDVLFGPSASTLSNLETAYSIRSLSFNSDAAAFTLQGAQLSLGSVGIT